MKRQLYTHLLLHDSAASAWPRAQTLNAYAKGAQEAFEKKDYYTAYNFLRIAHEIEPNNIVHTYNLAEAARHYAAFTMAEKYYAEVDSSANANDYPATNYWLGYVKRTSW